MTLMDYIEQALSYVELEHENRQAGDRSLPYSEEMRWVIIALIDAREEIKRLRRMVRKLFDNVDEDFAYEWAVNCISEQDMPWFRGEVE